MEPARGVVRRGTRTSALLLGTALALGFAIGDPSAEAEAPVEAVGSDGWPLSATLAIDYPAGYFGDAEAGTGRWRFEGTSWTDWSSELLTGPVAGECQVRRGGQELAGSEGCDGPLEQVATIDEDVRGGPSWMLSPSATARHQNLPEVALERMPRQAGTAAERAEVDASDVVAKVADGAQGCDASDIVRCADEGSAARMLVHRETGLVVFHESVDDGERMPTFRLEGLRSGS